jgi:ribonuclease-3
MYAFKNADLYQQAVTHKSFHNENPTASVGHNERLEFLGDAVLDLALSADLMTHFPDLTEGELSKMRASLVNESTLSEVAKELKLDAELRLGKGEQQTGGAMKPRLLASVFEALVGAVYQDSDFTTAQTWIREVFQARFKELDLSLHYKSDYKTRLQEKLQGLYRQTPQYELEQQEGPDHEKLFYVTLKMDGRVLGQGVGRSKKQAEQEAARAALEGEKI